MGHRTMEDNDFQTSLSIYRMPHPERTVLVLALAPSLPLESSPWCTYQCLRATFRTAFYSPEARRQLAHIMDKNTLLDNESIGCVVCDTHHGGPSAPCRTTPRFVVSGTLRGGIVAHRASPSGQSHHFQNHSHCEGAKRVS